jgi:aminopeptidase-like protein/aminoglycoside N3'-acetyltransferase
MHRFKPDYSKEDLVGCFRKAGLTAGQTVLSHSNIGFFGIPAEGNNRKTADRIVLEAFREVLGDSGTLVVPSFSYSFCKGEVFDPDSTPSSCGAWSEYVRTLPNAHRSLDPIFSVAAIGCLSEHLTRDVSQECFGPNSFWERFIKADGIICNLNVWVISTFVHYIEKKLQVPYRYDKIFPGVFNVGRCARPGAAVFFCQDASNLDTRAAAELFDELALNRKMAVKIPVGRGYITAMAARDVERLIMETLVTQPFFLTEAGREHRVPELLIPSSLTDVSLAPNATMLEIVEKICPLARDIISDGYDSALAALSRQIPMRVHEYPTGTSCFSWIIPEKWTCHEGWLETLSGKRLLDYRENPLHVMSYSDPFDGELSREELLEHLEVHPRIPSAVPFSYSYFHRKWGLCCSRELRNSLKEEKYRVCIKSARSFGTLKVGEVMVRGERDSGFVLCAHLDHPGQANDGLSGVAVGIEVMRRLLAGPRPRHTIRFLIMSETFGSLAWLSNHRDLIPGLHAGIFLNMLGLEYPHALQFSHKKDSAWDRIAQEVVQSVDAGSWTQDFLKLVTNDNLQFNAPGIRIPMLSLSRIKKDCGTGEGWPFAEYHTDLDNAASVSTSSMNESVEMVLSILDHWDRQTVPIPLYQAEPCLTRFGVSFDFASNPKLATLLFDVIYAIDGQLSVVEIAKATGMSMALLEEVLNQLAASGLVRI